MSAIASRFAAPASAAPTIARGATRLLPGLPARIAAVFIGFVAHDRDRWVSVVCVTGFVLLMWVDWLAA
jgi:hypothetical protein